MTAAVLTALLGLLGIIVTSLGQTLSARNERAALLAELDALTRMDRSSQAARDLS